nr:hypothetical protein [uncultured Cohaesibacter sp.]
MSNSVYNLAIAQGSTILEPTNFQEMEPKHFSEHSAINIVVGVELTEAQTKDTLFGGLDNMSVFLDGSLKRENICLSLSRRMGGYKSDNLYEPPQIVNPHFARILYPTKYLTELNEAEISGVAFLVPSSEKNCQNRVWKKVLPIVRGAPDPDSKQLQILVNSLGERDIVARMTWLDGVNSNQVYGICKELRGIVRAEYDRICYFDIEAINVQTVSVTIRPETGGESLRHQTIDISLPSLVAQ